MTEVLTTTAGFSVVVTPEGLLDGTRIPVRGFTERYRHFTFNPVTRRKEVKSWYRLYDRATRRLFLPLYDLGMFENWILPYGDKADIVRRPPTQGDGVSFGWSGVFSYKTDVQETVVESLLKLSEGIFPIAAQTGSGKSLHSSTPLKTPLGWTLMKDVRVGDILVGSDGRPTKVTGVFPQGVLPSVWLHTVDGRKVRCSYDHLWTAEIDGAITTCETHVLQRALEAERSVCLPMNTAYGAGNPITFKRGSDPIVGPMEVGTVERHLAISRSDLVLDRAQHDAFVDYCRSMGYVITTEASDDGETFTYALSVEDWIDVEKLVADEPCEMQCISVDAPDQLFVCQDCIVTHNTVSLFRTCMVKNVRTMVTMRTRLDQWESEFFKFTNATENQLYIIKGRESLERLVMLKEEGRMPDFIVASIQTMRRYVTGHPDYADLPKPSDFTDFFGIGMVGMDEFHEHLESNYLMMIALNPRIFVPITATFKKKDDFLNSIVNGFAPVSNRVGGGRYHSFVDVYGYECDMGYGEITRDVYMGPRGYSGTKLEKFFIKKGKKLFKEYFKSYFVPIFKEHYLNKRVEGDRVFILFTLVEMCYWFQKLMTKEFPEISSAVYVSGVSRSVLTEKELIITTPGSGGTGTDAPNVRSCFSFVAMAQETPLEQHLGRIRHDKHYTGRYDFVYLYFSRVSSHMDYELIREPLYREKGLTYAKRSYPP